MKISFLVTYYNQEQFVAQSLDSILTIKKNCDWEILVGDDGSSDGTRDIVMEYVRRYPEHISLYTMPRDPNVKYAPVQRASANRINLLEHATGDIYCVLDGDDCYCDTQFVEDAIRAFCKFDNVAAVMFGYKHVTDGVDGKCFTMPEQYHEQFLDRSTYLNGLYLHAGACVFRRYNNPQRMQLLKSTGYFDDNDIVIYNMYFGELYCINRVIYAYRQTGNSVYTSMNMVEQAVLNVQGYDVDNKYILPQYAEDNLFRNRLPIITVFIWKKNIAQMIGGEKLQRYLCGCKTLQPSLLVNILTYDTLPTDEKRMIKQLIINLMGRNFSFTCKNYLKLLFLKLKDHITHEKT